MPIIGTKHSKETNTTTNYELKSKNLIDDILQLVGALVQINGEIEKQIEKTS